ncbi:MAG: AAA family ATPase, partial [Patescibacteria group bacterium]|nr:AAA family ATPase [Patescibacteria group bacterium]
MAQNKVKELPPRALRRTINPNDLAIDSTNDGCKLEGPVIAQVRALDALNFGLGLKRLDYNVYLAGPSNADMEALTESLVKKAAQESSTPPDWLYVNNFRDSEQPHALSIKKGLGNEFKKDIDEFITSIKTEIHDVFESDDYVNRKQELSKSYELKRKSILEELEKIVESEGFVLSVGQTGMMIIPAKDGTPLSEEQIKGLDREEKLRLRSTSEKLQKSMNEVAQRLRKIEKDRKAGLKELDKQVALYVVGHHIEELQDKYGDNIPVKAYLDELKNDVVENLDDFRQKPETAQLPLPIAPHHSNLTRYEVNVFVNNAELEGAPVIVETNPTFPNLFGTIERKAQFGALFTDFTMVRAGSLHRANNGYLVIKVLDLLKNYYSYEGLKRVLKNGELSVEDLGEQLGLFTTRVIKPQPIPLDVKVVLIGSPIFYHLLYFYDEDFPKLFKVKAQLDDRISATPEHIREYISVLCSVVEKEKLLPLDKTGIARVIEYGAELAEHREKLSLRTAAIADILKEAAFWAGKDGSEMISAKHVENAVRQKMYRSNLYEERLQELIQEEIIKIETKGEVIGQVNGLSVLDLGDYMFARPTRITAAVSLGKEGVLDIEREAELGGSFHTKGVMILSGY